MYGSPELHPLAGAPSPIVVAVTLPRGAKLAPGETPALGYTFRYSLLAFYLRTQIVLTNRRLYAARPNTLFGLIPVGTRRSVFPIDSIAGVGATTRLSLATLVLGGLAGLIGFI